MATYNLSPSPPAAVPTSTLVCPHATGMNGTSVSRNARFSAIVFSSPIPHLPARIRSRRALAGPPVSRRRLHPAARRPPLVRGLPGEVLHGADKARSTGGDTAPATACRQEPRVPGRVRHIEPMPSRRAIVVPSRPRGAGTCHSPGPDLSSSARQSVRSSATSATRALIAARRFQPAPPAGERQEARRRLRPLEAVSTRDPRAVDWLPAQVPPTTSRLLDDLSPESWLGRIPAPLFLV